ncbi:MAG: PAS domain S-box protein [Alphaproteobacteria bacterium]|nr:PAS domain S-box protein [Alphaproteobacteria bacterium]
MAPLFVLGLSILLQLAAAAMALRLARTTGWISAWLLITSALLLMGARRAITFYHTVTADVLQPPNLTAELVALLISGLMLLGVAMIGPIFIARRKAEAALSESETTYRGILDNMADTFYRTNANGLIILVSPSASDLLGYSMDELIGMPLADLYYRPADRELFLKFLKENGGRAQGYVAPLRHKDGSPVFVETNARYLHDDNGVFLGVEGTVRDVTSRRRAEELNTRFGRIIEDSVNEIYVFDSETFHFILVNRGARENLGCTMAELQEMTPVDIKPEFTSDEFSRLVEPLRDGLRDALEFETVHARKDGSTYDVHVHLQLSQSETPPVFFAIIQDITERKRAEERLVQSQKMEAIGQLTGGVAHDFNNLLAIIMGNLELLLARGTGDSEISGFAAKALAATQRGANLTHRLLAFSRMQPLRPVSVGADQLVRGMEDLLVRTLGEAIEIKLNSSADLWPCEVDPGQLENALLNLSINARDAMPRGGRLTIETSNIVIDDAYAAAQDDVEAGEYVLLAVSDTGSGMAPEIIAQAFNPFFTTKGAGKGSGLGLSMVYGFVKQSGGHARICSEVGAGTTVKIHLPRSIGGQGVAPGTSAHPAANRPTTDTGAHGEVIMVVEDDAEVRAVAVGFLSQLGYEVLEAGRADAALEKIAQNREINLLLADIILPGGMGGKELADRACELLPSLKVLYMSGYTGDPHIHPGPPGRDGQLLMKPFGQADLAKKVRQALDGAAAR